MDAFLWTEKSKNRNKLTEKYEPLQPFLFLSFLQFSGAKVVLDIGSNIGLYSLIATLLESVDTVLSFEPDQAAFRELEKNIKLNGLQEKVFSQQVAVSNVVGKKQFGSHSPMSGVNGVLSTSIHDLAIFSETYDVNTVLLDSFKDIYGEVLGIKIDVEGHELNVIEGAKQLLLSCPSFIQVEHYVGSDIDDKLIKLGYFCFFVAGHDYYFTNIKNFRCPLFVKRAVEYASTWLIESSSGRLTNFNSIKNSLTITHRSSGGKIQVSVLLKNGYFLEPEFAFYLIVNGSKTHESWYCSTPNVTFNTPTEANSIEVKAFVREKAFPDKKVVVGQFVKQTSTGYRAKSAVEDSLGLPSQYISMVKQQAYRRVCGEEIDLTPLFKKLKNNMCGSILQIGGTDLAFDIAGFFYEKSIKLNFICSHHDALNLREKASLLSLDTHFPKFQISRNINDISSFRLAVNQIKEDLKSVRHVILMAQFIKDININTDELALIFTHIPPGVHIYTEALTNSSYQQQILSLSEHFGAHVTWLKPLSTIIPQNLHRYNYSDTNLKPEENFNFSNYPYKHSEYDFSNDSSQAAETAEHTLGLNFSLPVDRD